MSDAPRIRVSCEIILRRGDKILLGKRKNCFGAGSWALPAGHLEFNERLVDGACRELREEVGAVVEPKQLKLVSIADDVKRTADNNHYVHVTFELREPAFEPKLMEPELCEAWQWFSLSELNKETPTSASPGVRGSLAPKDQGIGLLVPLEQPLTPGLAEVGPINIFFAHRGIIDNYLAQRLYLL